MNIKQITSSILLAAGVLALGYFTANALYSSSNHIEYSRFNEQPKEKSLSTQNIEQGEKQKSNEQVESSFVTEAFSDQLSWVAKTYEQQARYPHYSMPVVDAELTKTPLPFEEARVLMPTFDENGNILPISIAASVDKLRYAVGEPITFQAQLLRVEPSASVFVDVTIKPTDSRTVLLENITLTAINQKQTEFRSTIDSASLKLDSASLELLAIVDVEINGNQYVTTVPFALSTASALLKGVGDSKQVQDFLEITLEYKVEEAGYYFVYAFLDDASTGRPLLSLQSEGRMSTGNSQLVLKAHQHALKDAGSPGPYTLRIARSFRGAEPGEGDDIHTGISQASYPIPDFSFDGYADLPFSDSAVDARLQALKELAGNG